MDSRYEGKQSNSTRNMKHVNFVPKDVQRILSSHKSIMNRKCSTGRLFLKISQYSQQNTFLIKMQAFKPFRPSVNIEKFLRTSILKYICERLLLKVPLELFPTWTNNIGSEEDVFSKIKQNKNRSNTQLYEKNLPFHDVFYHFVFLFFSTHVRRHLPYIIKKKTVLKQLNQWAINPEPMEKLFTYTVHFVLITWTSELGNAVFSSVL